MQKRPNVFRFARRIDRACLDRAKHEAKKTSIVHVSGPSRTGLLLPYAAYMNVQGARGVLEMMIRRERQTSKHGMSM